MTIYISTFIEEVRENTVLIQVLLSFKKLLRLQILSSFIKFPLRMLKHV